MKTRLILGDRDGELGRIFAKEGERVYSYHPAHKDQGTTVLKVGTSEGIVFLYGQEPGVDEMMDVLDARGIELDRITVRKGWDKLLPLVTTHEAVTEKTTVYVQ